MQELAKYIEKWVVLPEDSGGRPLLDTCTVVRLAGATLHAS